MTESNPSNRRDDVVDLDELYPLAWGTAPCSNCGDETTTTDAWGNPWCALCWAAR